jgi:hypothetical protein
MYVDHRLHWFVRSLEAILRLPRRGITQSFVTLAQEFIGDSPRNAKLLCQLYNLRSCIEHVKGYEGELRKPRGVQAEQAFAFWSLCAELLASEVYMKIFPSFPLMDCFRDEKRASGFWRRSNASRAGLLGAQIEAWSLAMKNLRHREAIEEW